MVLNAPDYNGVPPLVSAVSLVAVCPGGQRHDGDDSTSGSTAWSLDDDEGELTSDPATVRKLTFKDKEPRRMK